MFGGPASFKRFAELPKRDHLLITCNTGDNVTRETADDVGLGRSELKGDDDVPNNCSEGVSIIKTKRCQPVTAPTEIHGLRQIRHCQITIIPEIPRYVMTIRCRLVQRVFGGAKNLILNGDKFSGISK